MRGIPEVIALLGAVLKLEAMIPSGVNRDVRVALVWSLAVSTLKPSKVKSL